LKNDEAGILFPNPSTGIFNIKSPAASENRIEVYNSLGSKIYEAKYSGEYYTFDLKLHPDGLYVVKVSCDGRIILNEKVLKR
jgi:hypothetical protein